MLNNMEKKSRRNLIYFTSVIILALFTFLIYQIIIIQPKVKPTEISLTNEYRIISQLPEAKEVNTHSIIRMGIVTLQNDFVTDTTFQNIRDYYDPEFAKHGWQFESEKNLTTWGKDYGDKELIFKKGDYVLKLDYVANNPNYNFTYSIIMTWQ